MGLLVGRYMWCALRITIYVVCCLPRPPNRVRKLLCNLRTLKPRRVNIAVQVLCSSRVYSSITLSTFPYLNSNSIQHPTLMEGNIRSVQPYKKTLVITVPETPDYLENLLPSASSSSLPSSPNDTCGPLTTLCSPFNEPGWLDGSSSQPRLCQSPQNDSQKLTLKFKKMEALFLDSGFDSVGEILEIMFYNPSRVAGEPDPRGSFHAKAVSRFLQSVRKYC